MSRVLDSHERRHELQELGDELKRTRTAREAEPADLDGFLADGQRCASGEHRHQLGQPVAAYCDSYLNDSWILVR